MSAQLQPAHIVVSSKHRVRGDGPGQFSVNIAGAKIPPEGAYLSLERVVFPMYMLDFPSDVTYHWTEFRISPAASVQQVSTLPAGNYTAYSLCDLLQAEFIASSSYALTYSVAWDDTTGVITVKTNNSGYRWGLATGSVTNTRSFLNAVGMDDKITPAAIVVGTYVPEIGPLSIVINSETLALDSYSSDPENTASSMLAVVPLEGSPWETYVYSPPVPARYFIRQQIGTMSFRITRTDDNSVIDLRGGEIELHLLLERQ